MEFSKSTDNCLRNSTFIAEIMASKFARKCWESGIPLNEAWAEFAPEDLKARYAELPTFSDALSQGFDSENPISALSAIRGASEAFSEKRRIEEELRNCLLEEIYNENLIATGYRELPSRSQSPVRIEADRFESEEPDWGSETFNIHGIRYGRIRICDPDELKILPPSHQSRGSILAIDLVIDQLKLENPNFCEIRRKQACQLVRDHFGIDNKSGNGLSDQNISKAIVRKCGKRSITSNNK